MTQKVTWLVKGVNYYSVLFSGINKLMFGKGPFSQIRSHLFILAVLKIELLVWNFVTAVSKLAFKTISISFSSVVFKVYQVLDLLEQWFYTLQSPTVFYAKFIHFITAFVFTCFTLCISKFFSKCIMLQHNNSMNQFFLKLHII